MAPTLLRCYTCYSVTLVATLHLLQRYTWYNATLVHVRIIAGCTKNTKRHIGLYIFVTHIYIVGTIVTIIQASIDSSLAAAIDGR